MNKLDHYTALLSDMIGDAIQNDNSEFFLGNDVLTDDNLTDFMHALANVVPCILYNRLTKEDIDMLQFNHNMNRMCFQYLKSADES